MNRLEPGKPRCRSVTGRFSAHRPRLREAGGGALLWAVAMALSALLSLYLRNGAQTAHLFSVMLLYAAGGLFAWPLALWMARSVSGRRKAETRFAAFFLCLTLFTIAATAGLFALHYRMFYAQWHAPALTIIWMFQFAYTTAGALYQFLVIGVRLFLPLGVVALAVAGLWFATRQDDCAPDPIHR